MLMAQAQAWQHRLHPAAPASSATYANPLPAAAGESSYSFSAVSVWDAIGIPAAATSCLFSGLGYSDLSRYPNWNSHWLTKWNGENHVCRVVINAIAQRTAAHRARRSSPAKRPRGRTCQIPGSPKAASSHVADMEALAGGRTAMRER